MLLLSELLRVDGDALRDVVGLVDANQAVGELEHVIAEAFCGRGRRAGGCRQGRIIPSWTGNTRYEKEK